MARSNIPHALAMQEYKFGNRSASEKDALAATLRDAGRRAEAILLFEGRGGEHPFLLEERDWACKEGIAFHLTSLRNLGVPIDEDVWRRCATAAESRGRWLDARTCYVALEDREALARIAEHLPESLRIAPAAEGAEN